MGGLFGGTGHSDPLGERQQGSEQERGDRDRSRIDSSERLSRLKRTIEGEIIPRLLLANSAAACVAAPVDVAGSHPLRADVEELAGLVIRNDLVTAMAYIDSMRARGTSLDDIFLMLLAPTARYLGDLWENDLRNFAEVTVALTTLHQILHALSPGFESDWVQALPGHSALLLPARGESHTFGLLMLSEFFRRGGWEVSCSTGGEAVDFSAVAARHIDIVGFSLSCSDGLDDLASDIRMMRRKSRNKSIAVLVGGPAFIEHPERVALVGADGTAADGFVAVSVANRFVLERTAQKR